MLGALGNGVPLPMIASRLIANASRVASGTAKPVAPHSIPVADSAGIDDALPEPTIALPSSSTFQVQVGIRQRPSLPMNAATTHPY